MEEKQSLSNLFQDLGCKVESDIILDKCLELCGFYNVDVEKLTEMWLTFCINNNDNIDPTLEGLVKMENTLLKKHSKSHSISKENSTNQEQTTVDKQIIESANFDNDDVLSIYGYTTDHPLPKRARGTSEETEADTRANKTKVSECSFLSAENSNAQNHRSVTDTGKVLTSFGQTVASWKRAGDYDVEVTKSNFVHVPDDIRYMYEILSKQGRVLTFVCHTMGTKLFKLWSAASDNATELRYVRNVRTVSQTNFRTFGRVITKKASANTVSLEGCVRRSGASAADTIELDFRNLKQYSVFSGQIVAVEATNPVDDTLYVREIFAKGYAPLAPAPTIQSQVNIFVAAGPFTVSNNMHYASLWNLMEKVAADEPHVLILIGPFLEYTHPEIQDNLIKDTFQEAFEKILIRIMETVRKNTYVMIVASNRDVHHEPVFPTPHYSVFNRKLLQNYQNLKLMPDPCILDVAGLKIGVTSVDVIKHIGKEEVSNISGMDRLSRLADHVLAQNCFYPVYPPSEDLNVDTELWESYAFFDQQPHVLILPSDMRCYCKVINECVTLNPERMHKHAYARLCVKPSLNDTWSSDNITCEIAKV